MNLSKMFLLTFAAVCPLSLTTETQKENKAPGEMKAIQGSWQVTKWIDSDGSLAPADEVKGTSFEFKEDRAIKSTDGRARPPLKFTLDPSKKPKWIDFDAGAQAEVKMQGIYKLEGDELTICIISGSRSDQAPERPTEFKANKQKHHTVFVLKKASK